MFASSGAKIHHNLANGSVVITKAYNQIIININASKNYLRLSSGNLRIVANSNSETYFQVIKPHPRDEQRVAAALNRFQVKNGSQKAGFDINDELVLMWSLATASLIPFNCPSLNGFSYYIRDKIIFLSYV